jgi:hypothetical protein
LSYAVLIGTGFNVLYVSLKKYSKNLAKIIVGIFSFLIFVVYMWPFWTGDLMYAGGKTKPSARVRIPDCYYEAKEWLSQQQEQFKILSLPHQEGVCYDWEYGYVGSDDPAIRLFQRPILTTYVPNDEIIGSYLSDLLGLFTKPGGSKNIAKFLGLTNIRYVLLHNDLNYLINTPNPEIKSEDIGSILNSQEGIHLERSFDKLDFYKISDGYFLPHIYTSITPTVVSGDIEALAPILETRYLDEKPLLIFSEHMEKGRDSKLLGNQNIRFVFKDSNWQDLAVQESGYKLQIADKDKHLSIEKTGIYEIYVDVSEINKKISEFDIKIDGKVWIPDTTCQMPDKGRKYVKILEVEMVQGEHDINIKNQISKIKDTNQNLKIILVNKEERQNLEKEIWEKINSSEPEAAYILSYDEEFYVP